MPDESRQSYRPASVAERKRRQRARLKDLRLKPVEVWIPAEHRSVLRRVENLLRQGIVPDLPTLSETRAIGMKLMDLNLMRETLDGLTTEDGFTLSAAASGDDMIEVVVEDREEFPILVTVDAEQILCLIYLWDDAQVAADKRLDLLSLLLEMNVSLPLSSFGRIGDRFVIFGALAAGSSAEDVITEIEVLSGNALEAVEAVTPYLH